MAEMITKIDSENDLRRWVKEVLSDRTVERVEAAPGTTDGTPDLSIPVEVPGSAKMATVHVELKLWHRKGPERDKAVVAEMRPAQRAWHRRASAEGRAAGLLVAVHSGKYEELMIYFIDSSDCPRSNVVQMHTMRLVWKERESIETARSRLLGVLRRTMT